MPSSSSGAFCCMCCLAASSRSGISGFGRTAIERRWHNTAANYYRRPRQLRSSHSHTYHSARYAGWAISMRSTGATHQARPQE